MSKKETDRFSLAGVRKLENGGAIVPYELIAAICATLTQVRRIEFLGGFVKWTDRLLITKDEASLNALEEQVASIRDTGFEIPRGPNGQLLWDEEAGGPVVDTVESHSDLGGGGINLGGSSGSSGGSTGSSGGSGSNSGNAGGGLVPDPESNDIRVVAGGAQTVNLDGGSVSVTLQAQVFNFSDDEIESVEWRLTGVVTGVDALVKDTNPATFTFDEAGQYIASIYVTIGGAIYSGSTRITVSAEEGTVISAGADATVDAETNPTTNFTGSVDPDQTVMWSLISGDAGGVSIADPTSPTSQVTFSVGGSFTFRLAVTGAVSVSDTVTYTVAGISALRVTAAPKQVSTNSNSAVASAFVGAFVSESGADMEWTCTKAPAGSPPQISSPNSDYTAVTVFERGLYTFRVTATYEGESASDTVQVYHSPTGTNYHWRVVLDKPATGGVYSKYAANRGSFMLTSGAVQSWGGQSFARSNSVSWVFTSIAVQTWALTIEGAPYQQPGLLTFQMTDDFQGAGGADSDWWTVQEFGWLGEGTYGSNGIYTAI